MTSDTPRTPAPEPPDNTAGEPDVDSKAHANRWRSLIVLALALSLVVIDGTIVAVAIPDIVQDLGMDLSDAQWVSASYAVVLAAFLLTAGSLGDRLGRRRILTVGVILFLIGSLIAASADSAGSLIVGRLVQGLGATAILPGTLSTVNATFRGKDRAAAFGIWGAVISGAAALGPLAGGWLTTSFTWPWIFLVNLPVAAIVLIGVFLWVPETKISTLKPGFDIAGLVTSALGFGLIVFALIEGQTFGWWNATADLDIGPWTWPQTAPISIVPVALVVGFLLLALFVANEKRQARRSRLALLDLTLFRLPTFRWGNLTAMTVAVGEFGIIFVLPLFLVNVLALSTMGAGYVLAAMALGAFVSGASARHVAAKFGAPQVVVLGLSLEVIGVLLVAWIATAGVSPWALGAVLVVYGAGLGFASAQLTGTTLSQVPPEQSGEGSAAQSTARQVGSALGTAVVGAALAAALATTVPQSLEPLALPDPEVQQLTDATADSAGSIISQGRDLGTDSPLGEATPDVVESLEDGFADATRASLLVAAVFLSIGLGGSLMVRRAARQNPELA
ncbi:DHA2 family efflux MFS transporter permease subunit [Demequina sediminicola]|uniref:DHA2 family efflux MFS transporter permease subunit n=1 Tax=Demequina sediminicola TaxID=1095026 RepID=UPI000B2175CE|nr:DHA2 family efflux MFS transporter permease subunit [Demequina sediminicola]